MNKQLSGENHAYALTTFLWTNIVLLEIGVPQYFFALNIIALVCFALNCCTTVFLL